MSVQKDGIIPAFPLKRRKDIRRRVRDLLKGKTGAGERVFPSASIPTDDEELPAIGVYTRSEPVTLFNQAPRELERRLQLAIEIVAKGPQVNEEGEDPDADTLDDILDDIAAQVEREMDRDQTLGGVVDDSILESTEFQYDGSGAAPIGSARLTYTLTYYAMAPANSTEQGVTADNTEESKVEWHIGNVNPATRELKDDIAHET